MKITEYYGTLWMNMEDYGVAAAREVVSFNVRVGGARGGGSAALVLRQPVEGAPSAYALVERGVASPQRWCCGSPRRGLHQRTRWWSGSGISVALAFWQSVEWALTS